MKSKTIILLTLFLTTTLFSFKKANEISKCFISFTNANNLTIAEKKRFLKKSTKLRTLWTENGNVEVTRVDGYDVSYNNDKKVELSAPNSYEADQKNELDCLKFL